MNKKIILSLLAIFIILTSVSIVSAGAETVDFGKFTLAIDGEQLTNTTMESGGEQVSMYDYDLNGNNLTILVMPGQEDNDAIIDSFINDDGYKKTNPIGEFIVLETPEGNYEGIYFGDDYWVAIIFNDLDSGKQILESFKTK